MIRGGAVMSVSYDGIVDALLAYNISHAHAPIVVIQENETNYIDREAFL